MTGYAAEGKSAAAKAAGEQQTQTAERETVSHYEGWEDPDMARVAVHGGRALLRHVEAAQAALDEKKVDEARTALTAADDFAKGLQLMIPYTVVVDSIRNAKHELTTSSTGLVVDDLLPIYANLEEMAEFAPEVAKKAKAKLDEAARHAKAGEKTKAAKKLEEVATDIAATTVYLPVLYVQDQVEAAIKALDKKPADKAAAKSDVDKAMDSLVHATVNMHLFPEENAAGKSAPATAKEKK
jgi:hypothetical protein